MNRTCSQGRLLVVFASLVLVLSACSGAEEASEASAASDPAASRTPEAGAASETPAEEGSAESDTESNDTDADRGAEPGGSVRVGMITTLSGGAAYIGEDIRDAFELAFERDGGWELDLVVEDDMQDPDTGSQLGTRMLGRDDVDVMTGIVFSNVAGAVVPQVVGQDVIYLSSNAGPSTFAGEQCNENYFVVSWQNDNLAEAVGELVADEGLESVVALAANYQAGQDSIVGFERTYGEAQAEIFTEFGATDYAGAIAQIRDADPDGVYFFYPGAMGIAFVRQFNEAGLDIPLFAPNPPIGETLVDAIGESSLGLQSASFWTPDLDVAANGEFVEAFREAYDRTPTAYAAQSYDTANLLISALDATGDPSDTAAMREALGAADFDSVRGDFRFGNNNHPIQDWYLTEVVEGEEEGDFTFTAGETVLTDHVDAYAQDCEL